jgi:solute carrier family 13 (sodium-dependent dicarboxylate transporter), member 2/3/5
LSGRKFDLETAAMSQPNSFTAAEQRFEDIRRRAGFLVGPLVMLALWFAPLEGLSVEAHKVLAILGLVVTLWMTESIPLPVTALLGPALCVLAGVGPAKAVFQSFADPIIFLFLGSFLLAQAMLHHGLNRRIAFLILGWRGIGASPGRLLFAFGLIAGGLSMWVSNTATTAMMFPIGISILTEMARRQSQQTGREIHFTQLPFGVGLMLLAAYGASIGGLATPVGTPPNLVGIRLIESRLDIVIPFFRWMSFGLPLALLMIGFLVFYFKRVCPVAGGFAGAGAEWIAAEKRKLGRWTRGELNVTLAFGFTVLLWVFPGFLAVLGGGTDTVVYQWLARHLPEAVVALLGASLLFFLPVNAREGVFTLHWQQARQIDWGTILLFGGGLALGDLMFSTGLASWIGEGLSGLMRTHTTLTLTILFTVVASMLSETTSNVASATMVVPVAIAVAQAAGIDALQPALGACLGASMGFMLPVSTPPNAIVYGSGCVPVIKMVKYGFLLNVVGCSLIVIIVTWWVPLVF